MAQPLSSKEELWCEESSTDIFLALKDKVKDHLACWCCSLSLQYSILIPATAPWKALKIKLVNPLLYMSFFHVTQVGMHEIPGHSFILSRPDHDLLSLHHALQPLPANCSRFILLPTAFCGPVLKKVFPAISEQQNLAQLYNTENDCLSIIDIRHGSAMI